MATICQVENGRSRGVVAGPADCFPTGVATPITVGPFALGGGWTNLIVQYRAAGHGDGKGGDVVLYRDGNVVATLANPSKYDFFGAQQATGSLSAAGSLRFVDELRVYNTVYDDKTQCTQLLYGTFDSVKGACNTIAAPFLDLPAEGFAANFGTGQGAMTFTLGNALWEAGKLGKALHLQPAPIGGLSGVFGAAPGITVNALAGHTTTVWFDDVTGGGDPNGNLVFTTMSKGGIEARAKAGSLVITMTTQSSQSTQTVTVP